MTTSRPFIRHPGQDPKFLQSTNSEIQLLFGQKVKLKGIETPDLQVVEILEKVFPQWRKVFPACAESFNLHFQKTEEDSWFGKASSSLSMQLKSFNFFNSKQDDSREMNNNGTENSKKSNLLEYGELLVLWNHLRQAAPQDLPFWRDASAGTFQFNDQQDMKHSFANKTKEDFDNFLLGEIELKDAIWWYINYSQLVAGRMKSAIGSSLEESAKQALAGDKINIEIIKDDVGKQYIRVSIEEIEFTSYNKDKKEYEKIILPGQAAWIYKKTPAGLMLWETRATNSVVDQLFYGCNLPKIGSEQIKQAQEEEDGLSASPAFSQTRR